jgi:hypothetical protein
MELSPLSSAQERDTLPPKSFSLKPYNVSKLLGVTLLAYTLAAAAQKPDPVTAETIGVVQTVASPNIGAINTLPPGQLTDVVTYHNDKERTGWNRHETTLTPATVNATSFGLLATVPLDDRVDAQPLLVASQSIEGWGMHSVLYVATENNSIYAIDAESGAILKTRNLGSKFISTGTCPHSVGVNSTPTIDLLSRTLYVMAGTRTPGGVPQYQLHALALATLKDQDGSPVVVTASQDLGDGTKFTFDATYQRQRPALLQSQGKIYAGFGSFGDCFGDKTRGWVLGWEEHTLLPLPGNELTNRKPVVGSKPVFLTSIWMSGYGLAADTFGNVYFSTGNSASGSYDEVQNISESAVQLSSNLNQVLGFFTPFNEASLDVVDDDFGAGGLLVLPDQAGHFPHIAVAGGKDGRLFVLNRDSMGGFHTPDLPNEVFSGGCWCGPSYFELPAGPRVVTSGYTRLREWSVAAANERPTLSMTAALDTAVPISKHDPGFFTSISSDGLTQGSAIIWAVGHGTGNDNSLSLLAFDATPANGTLSQLWAGTAGVWPTDTSDPNVVPTVANGHVYVASINQVRIFGLIPPQANTKQAK